jgi:hypothetical protein
MEPGAPDLPRDGTGRAGPAARWNRARRRAVWTAMHTPTDRRLLGAGLASAILLAACTGGANPSPSAPAPTAPTGSPVVTPAGSSDEPTGQIVHPRGSTDLVLRFEEGGGFVMPTFALIQVPYFSLYGDGTVIYRPASAPFPEQKPGEPLRFPALRVAKMTEVQVQALLRDALGDGGLGVAKPRYENQVVADAPTAVFTLDVDGRQRTVSVYALGIGSDPANPQPDDEVLAAMASFAERLRDFDREVAQGNAVDVGLYQPQRFRASLLEGGFVEGPVRPWPWPTFGPEAFVAAGDAGGFGFPSKVLDGLEVSLLDVADPAGGVSGIGLRAANGLTYVLGLRPLLPDETR